MVSRKVSVLEALQVAVSGGSIGKPLFPKITQWSTK